MRTLLTSLLCVFTLSLTAQETITYPYNPDSDNDAFVASTDLLELLTIYGTSFEVGEIMVNDITFEAYLNELYMLIEAAALPNGTADGQFLKWNGSEWVLVLPVAGCTDSESCSYDATAHVHLQNLCIYEDACGVCDGPGDIYECGCADIPEGNCDCDGNQVDALNVCGGSCSADDDGDGICDDGDACIGEADECGVCNGPGAIYDCGCTEPAPDTCDCEGNVVDVVGVCGGGCQEDADADGICDSQDDCVGEFDDCGVCNGPGPILGCGCENIPEGDCDCQGNQLDAVGTCGGACQTDINGDGVCDDDSIPGCTYDAACNYDPSASINDGSCDFTSCYGCTDPTACNYSPAAYIDNQSCWYASFALDCESNCLNDSDGDGFCDELEIYGCTDEEYACNYDSGATEFDDSCTYPGCTDSTSCNFDPEAGCNDGSCAEEGDVGCIDSNACNYDSEAICGGIECVYPGCTYEQANNYNPLAGCDDGSCIIEGCIVDLACNFDPLATTDDGSCEFGNCPGCNDSGAINYNPTSTNDEACFFCGDLVSHDGYDYSTVLIGEQCWFAENCRYLPSVSPSSASSTTAPFYYVYDYQGTDVEAAKATDNYETYGVLYNWPAVMTEGICPSGWHIPSDEEFTELTDFLGGESVAGYAMKSASGWEDGGNGSNSSGFTGLPGGYCDVGYFWDIGNYGIWWSASEFGSESWLRTLYLNYDNVHRDYVIHDSGFSARCVRD